MNVEQVVRMIYIYRLFWDPSYINCNIIVVSTDVGGDVSCGVDLH